MVVSHPHYGSPCSFSRKSHTLLANFQRLLCEHHESMMPRHQRPTVLLHMSSGTPVLHLLHQRASRKTGLKVRCDQGRAAGRHPGGRCHRAAGSNHCGGGHQPTHVAQRPSAAFHGYHLQVRSGQVALQACHGAQGEHPFQFFLHFSQLECIFRIQETPKNACTLAALAVIPCGLRVLTLLYRGQ